LFYHGTTYHTGKRSVESKSASIWKNEGRICKLGAQAEKEGFC
jgi:hypothetical protein